MTAAPSAPSAPMLPPAACIGVFDSGLGGLSVLRALRAALPQVPMVYAADSAFAPYGERDEAYVLARSRVMTQYLLTQGAVLVVNACNTATALAAPALRAEFSPLPMVGIEPAIKPAAQQSKNGKVGVLATRGTLESAKFAALLAHVQALYPLVAFTLHTCDGLAAAVENLTHTASERHQILSQAARVLTNAGCDTVVLGCTHYPLIAHEILNALRYAQEAGNLAEVVLIDPAEAVAAQAVRLWRQVNLSNSMGQPDCTPEALSERQLCEFYSTGNLKALQLAATHFIDTDAPLNSPRPQ